MSDPHAIRFESVSKRYQDRAVLEDFCLEVFSGELLAVIGASGSGKTTILKLINGLIEPDAGRVMVEDRDVAAMSEQDRITLRRHIGYVIQGIGLFPHLTIEANIAYVPGLLGGDTRSVRRRVRELCAVVGLEEDLLGRHPAALSGGQQQRVGIARALAASPRIVLMDEPFGAVDAITRTHLQDEITRIHAAMGMTVVFVTHDVDEALKLGSRILVMAEGGMQQLADPETMLAAPATAFVAELLESSHAHTRAAC